MYRLGDNYNCFIILYSKRNILSFLAVKIFLFLFFIFKEHKWDCHLLITTSDKYKESNNLYLSMYIMNVHIVL